MLLELAISACLVAGSFFLLVGALGLARLPDFYMRLHAPTKASTLGIGGLLLAAILSSLGQGEPELRGVLIAAFVFVTAPVSASMLARAALRRRVKSRAAPPGDGTADRASLGNSPSTRRVRGQ